jgi:ADP-ribose pyrophosphatase YjhB (NUDIX family)
LRVSSATAVASFAGEQSGHSSTLVSARAVPEACASWLAERLGVQGRESRDCREQGGSETGKRGEGLTGCAAREIREETGLYVKIPRLLYVGEVLTSSGEKHVLDLIFLGELVEVGQPIRPSRHWTIEVPHFVPLPDLPALELYPAIASEILEDLQTGWDGSIQFLGNLWVDVDLAETVSRPEQARESPVAGRKT